MAFSLSGGRQPAGSNRARLRVCEKMGTGSWPMSKNAWKSSLWERACPHFFTSSELFLPAQIGKNLFDDTLFVYGEVGYNVVFDDESQNSFYYGVAAEWKVSEKLELVGEVGVFIFPRGTEPDDTFFNLGITYELRENLSLLVSAGRSFHDGSRGEPQLLAFVGLQFLTPGRDGMRR